MSTDLADGLYAVVHDEYGICAGVLVAGGRVVECAPILQRELRYWLGSKYLRVVQVPSPAAM